MLKVTIELDGFAGRRLKAEAEAQGVAVDAVVRHAVMYYLADLDDGRPAARVMRSPVEADGADPETERHQAEPANSDERH
jgi:hypothetical protein